MAKIKLKTNNLILISAYAPTEETSKVNPKERDEFYEELEQLIENVKKRDFVIIAGDFNARVGKTTEQHADVVGNYAKGTEPSANGIHLIELCKRNNLITLNTFFKHKMAHRTTWTSPKTPVEPRRNKYRNQIDYILIRRNHLCLAKDARSYGGTKTNSDHKLVKAEFEIKWHKIKFNHADRKPDHSELRNPDIKVTYENKVKELLGSNKKEIETPQEKWNRICKSCHQAADETIPKPLKNGKKNNEEIKKLSEIGRAHV